MCAQDKIALYRYYDSKKVKCVANGKIRNSLHTLNNVKPSAMLNNIFL